MPRKLLLADDSVTIQRVIEMTFAGEDIQVLTVGDGEEAIARIPIEKPDIVLADIGMPKRSGYEVSAFVKGNAEFANTPVLLLAGAFEPVDEAKAQEAKCDGVLVKPFEPQHVIARVRELIGGAKGSPTESAVRDIPRPAAALAPPRPVELPIRQEQPPIPEDLVDFGEDDLMPRFDDAPRFDGESIEPIEGNAAVQPIVVDDALDDYFDKLDEAFATINTSVAPATAEHSTRPGASASDSFAGIDGIQAPEASFPTLDDLLADMPATPQPSEISFDDLTAPGMTFDAPPVADTPAPPVQSTFIPSPPRPRTPPSPIHAAPEPVVHVAVPADESTSGRSIIADAFSALLAAEQGEPGAGVPLRLGSNGAAPVMTDGMIDDVARRVIQRLALGSSEQMQSVVKDIVSGIAERLVREEIDRIRRNAPPT